MQSGDDSVRHVVLKALQARLLSSSLLLVTALSSPLWSGCKRERAAPRPAPSADGIDASTLALFKPPLPVVFESKDNLLTEQKVKLGRMLYYDTRLSLSRKLSCNTCHLLDHHGVDSRKVSLGHEDQPGKRNAPTVYNAAGHFVQFWDGRAADVEEQAKGPILNPVEMGMPSDKEVVAQFRLEHSPEYVELFKSAFPGEQNDPVTFDNIAKAIGAFERKLITPSRWDKFLAGESSALTDAEKAGFKTFVATGCNACHTGTLVGGSFFRKLGLVVPWPDTRDFGRYEVTKNEADKMMFKVPSLRNVEKTAPYFHDGSIATLEEAVRLMAKHQLGKDLKPEEATSIITWLTSLTGEIPTEYIAKPTLPPIPNAALKASPSAAASALKAP